MATSDRSSAARPCALARAFASRTLLVAVLAALASTASCGAARSSVEVGSPLQLRGADGATTRLTDLTRQRDATVLVFWSGSCPCVRRYQRRVDALLDRYPAERVRVVGVASNAGESLVDVERVARERGVRIPILRDEGGELARALGVKSTPTIVVVDRRGDVRFLGWLDNEREPGESGREPWLERALDGILAGRTDFQARTPTYGCAITRSLFGAPAGACCTNK
jgi:peroxiredoxin